jgi:hypothetical protein
MLRRPEFGGNRLARGGKKEGRREFNSENASSLEFALTVITVELFLLRNINVFILLFSFLIF